MGKNANISKFQLKILDTYGNIYSENKGEKMKKLIENELIKIFKRKNIYILLFIGILMIVGYSMFQKIWKR